MPEIFTTTLLHRPYVAAFLLAYLFIAWRSAGPVWTMLYLCTGYSIAFASEYLSINYGFPYGWYHYVYENLAGEWLNHGVPVWDSASYVFMNFAGLGTARIVLSEWDLDSPRGKVLWLLLSAMLVTLLDVVVDPVAHQGEKWFLGRIYYYPEPGFYFDVTLANFAGWYLVSLAINGVGILLPQRLLDFNISALLHVNAFLILGLYYGIFAFGLGIAISLQHWTLVACDLGWIGLTVGILTVNRAQGSMP